MNLAAASDGEFDPERLNRPGTVVLYFRGETLSYVRLSMILTSRFFYV